MNKLFRLALILVISTEATYSYDNQPLYQDPFDLGAGGAALTRASRDGRLFANPALLSQGDGFHRWFGTTTSIAVNKESVDLARSFAGNSSNEEEGESTTNKIIAAIFENPLHIGFSNSIALLNSLFGASIFSGSSTDFSATEIGTLGTPEVNLAIKSYNGIVIGSALSIPGVNWLSVGASIKKLWLSENSLNISLSDTSEITKYSNPDELKKLATFNTGTGLDLGALLFFQGHNIDYSLALSISDLGNTTVSGDDTDNLLQTINLGVALDFHLGSSAVHLALDYRDVKNAYSQQKFKRIYAGTKIMLLTYLGVATGVYHGYPSYGLELDLIFLRLTATYYTKELGNSPNVQPRRVYMLSLSSNLWPF